MIAGVGELWRAASAPADEPPVPTLPTPPDTALDKNRGFAAEVYAGVITDLYAPKRRAATTRRGTGGRGREEMKEKARMLGAAG